jgi:lipoprotein-anchoring transpeptidase ErfK/SrfK
VLAITGGIVYAVTASRSSGSVKAAAPIRVVSVSPANQATGVDGANPILVTFSRPVSASSQKPTLTPNVPGSWTAFGDQMEFTPTAPFNELTQVTVKIPGGPTGVHSSAGGLLTTAVTSQFTTAAYSQAGLAVLLARQGYLPLNFVPDTTTPAMASDLWGADEAADTPQGEAYQPPPGTFAWDSGYPSSLVAEWSPDQANVILQGAVMAFKSEHNMTIDGSLTPQLWTALFQAQERGEQNANGYTYAIANKGSPETLTIWHNGRVVLTSLANTGIPAAPTVDGTFPVYERFLNTVMSGFNPDGSYYSDPVQFVSYFNGGDAVHYFARGSYGYPQSLGCVELPYNDAQQAYPYLTYGSLVSVQG